MIPDGPGLSGAMYEPIASQMVQALQQQYTIYLMDHRGTGKSNPALHCPIQAGETREAPEGDCTEYLQTTYGDKMDYFSSEFIARDYNLITNEITQNSNAKVLLYGGGYGGYVINRILLENSTQINAIVLDSFLFPSLTETDENAQDTGSDFLDRCQNFESCREQIDRRDPEELMEDIFKSFADLSCPPQLGLTRSDLQIIFRNMANDKDYRALVLPVVVRMLRCNSEDLVYLRTGINTFLEVYYENNQLINSNSSIIQGQSYVLRNHLDIIELLPVDRGFQPGSQELLAVSENLYFSNYNPSFVTELSSNYPWDSTEDFDNFDFAISSVPTLILAGEFDFKVSSIYSALAADKFDNEKQRFLEIPFGGHLTIYNTPTQNGVNCGFELIAEFFNSNDFDPFSIDMSCISRLAPIDYAAEQSKTIELSIRTFGSEPWGSGNIPEFFGSISFSSQYVEFPFSTNDLPPIPDLTLSQIIVFDTYDSSNPQTFRNTLSFISTGILPPSAWFSPDGAVVGSASIFIPSYFCYFICFLFIALFTL